MISDVASVGWRVATAVSGLSDIDRLSSGAFGALCTPVPGGRIEGVALRDGRVRVGVVARLGRPLPEVAAEVHNAVHEVVPDRGVHVSIEDVTPAPTGSLPE